MTDEQTWREFVRRKGFLSKDQEAARFAFICGLRIGRGDDEDNAGAAARRITDEMNWLRNDTTTMDALANVVRDPGRAAEIVTDFETFVRASGKTHYSMADVRRHFFNWFMKRKDYGAYERARGVADEWRNEVVERMRRLAGA